ncbi:MAG: alpha/beta fold hydrolase [Bauldia sp.]|nr:alpha/beta fold hydrolase [Bauldia sp.]
MNRRPRSKGNAAGPATAGHDLSGAAPFLWPGLALAEAGHVIGALTRGFGGLVPTGSPREPWSWTTPNVAGLELRTMRLRDFSTSPRGPAVLVCAPFSLHQASIADLAHGHSLIAALRAGGLDRLFLTEWLSATPEMRFLGIDDYLADLNVAIDDLGGRVDLVGICQGGWMSLLYAARFPAKVRSLVLAGSPIDLSTDSSVSSLAKSVPLSAFASAVQLGGGRILGAYALEFWSGSHMSAGVARNALQLDASDRSASARATISRLRDWNTRTVDLPGAYYLEVVERLFHDNQLAAGRFVALGKTVDLGTVAAPTFLLAASDDEIVPPAQLLDAERLLGTPKRQIRHAVVEGSHLSLFMGARTLRTAWPHIATWLRSQRSARAGGRRRSVRT